MKTALLICDHINKAFKAYASNYPDMFGDLLPELEMEPFFVVDGEFPASVKEFDAYIVTGSKFSVYEDVDWIIRLKTWVQEIQAHQKKFVGVCFGHQMLGEALGGKVEKSPQGWCVGVHTFELKVQEPWMEPAADSVNLLMMCQDQVVKLPPGGKILASSPKCQVAMFKVGNHMLGIQAHPEFSKAYDQALMETRVERMGIETVREGIESLQKPVHKDLVSTWIMNFLYQ